MRHAARAIGAIPPLPSRHLNAVIQRWTKTAASAGLPDGVARFFAKTQISADSFRARVFDPDFLARAGGGDGEIARLGAEYFPDPTAISADTLEQFGLCDLALNLPGAMLTKVDRASMAHSLEVRTPFLAHDFVDWALGVPIGMKHRGGVGKYIVREAIRPWLPPGILARGKQGFRLPLAQWFAGDFGAHARSLWRDSGAAGSGFLDSGAVERLFAEHRGGGRDHGRTLYALAMFALWWADRHRGSPAAV